MKQQHRADIDGLRAVAVAMVILYHAKVPGFSFGFWGVDVFLVISGYLITGNIAREVGAGAFSLAQFWARRVRRLMPAAALLVVATVLGVVAVGSPLEWHIAGSDAIFSSTYLLNFAFGLREYSYFDADAEVRPFLHMWSLALEEQFYLFWPLFLPGLLRRSRRLAVGASVVLLVLSVAAALVFSGTAPTPSFFLLPTRLWEFAAGGVLALLAVPTPPPWLRAALATLAVLLFSAAVVLLTPMTPLPGALTTLPVLATVLMIAAGPTSPGPFRLLTLRPLVVVGAWSYSLYLWHWPVLVLGRQLVGTSAVATAALIALTFLCAVLAHELVEKRVRFAPFLLAPRRTFAMAVVLVGLGGLSGVVLRAVAATTRQQPFYAALVDVRLDAARYETCATVDGCVIRDAGSRTVVVLGDSHAMQWVPAVEAAASSLDVRVVFAGRSACPAMPLRTTRPERRDGTFAECARWQELIPATLDHLRPDLVVVANYEGYSSDGRVAAGPAGSEGALRAVAGGADGLAGLLATRQIPTVFVRDIPQAQEDPIRCAARLRSLDRCDIAPAPTEDERQARGLMARPFEQSGAVMLDGTLLVCSDAVCPLQRDGIFTYRDRHHVTRTFSQAQGPAFARAMNAAFLGR